MDPGASYLTSQMTIKKFREYVHSSRVWPTLNLEKWEELNCPKADDTLRSYTDKLLDDIEPPEDHLHILNEGEKIIKNILKK